jgi:hypothetical protein
MLPDAQDRPTPSTQALIGIPIALSIGLDLVAPPFGVRLRPGSMDGAPVPKASVQEDSQPRSWEDDVHRPCRARQETQMDPETKTATMEH